jgi:hypothetical protein
LASLLRKIAGIGSQLHCPGRRAVTFLSQKWHSRPNRFAARAALKVHQDTCPNN